MIIESNGLSVTHTESTASATMIVAATGTAYVRKGKIKSVMRFFRKAFAPVREILQKVYVVLTALVLHTKSGKPTSIDPPANHSS